MATEQILTDEAVETIVAGLRVALFRAIVFKVHEIDWVQPFALDGALFARVFSIGDARTVEFADLLGTCRLMGRREGDAVWRAAVELNATARDTEHGTTSTTPEGGT